MSALDGFRAVGAARLLADVLEPPLSADELVAVRQLIEERFGVQGMPRCEPERTGHYGFQAFTDEDSSRAVGMQRAASPGEVSADTPDTAPSPGHPDGHEKHIHVNFSSINQTPDSELLIRAAIAVDHAANAAKTVARTTELLNLADELRDRAAQFAALEALETP
ncbi:hypothetical protein [Mycolicibacterium goodii]|uniref:hypothetical protein n=1 Tax=Mycolicibacterium goodii TaxID=134601 RepID=UPI001BDCADA2|nr:hypothetical protein [Mycolicibacterium goodii]MBU8816389.1 hypothetical protein [Mycolicibacterium goodii]MBU8833642.1 hypothetical protein [Mycolicibacterium goodii]